MTLLIAASTKDPAGLNITEKLIQTFGFEEADGVFEGKRAYKNQDLLLALTDVDTIYASHLDQNFNVEAIIFASKHKSESGQPTLTVHVPGNFGKALYGGRPRELAWACPQRMKNALTALWNARDELSLNYSVSLEATHHGPTEMKVPVMFVEVGSSEKQWTDDLAGEAAAKAIWSAATMPKRGKPAVGFGGGHYSPKLTEVVLERDVAIGHIMPKYATKDISNGIVKSMFKKTKGNCRLAVMDWKGIHGDDRKKLLELLEGLNVDIVRV